MRAILNFSIVTGLVVPGLQRAVISKISLGRETRNMGIHFEEINCSIECICREGREL